MSNSNWKYQSGLGLKFDIVIGIAIFYLGFAFCFLAYLFGYITLGINELCLVQFSETRIYLCTLIEQPIFLVATSLILIVSGIFLWRLFQKTKKEYRKSK